MAKRSVDDEMQKWRDLVGGFILAFGDIELITYRLWSEQFRRKEPPNRFAARTKQLLIQLNGKTPKEAELRALLEESMLLSRRRNTIAHNPLQVDIFEHTLTGKVLFEPAISAYGGKDRIDDLELIELRAKAEDIVSRLYMLIGIEERT